MSTPSFSSVLHNGTYRTRYLFNGKELDTETNLYYYGARYFEPNIAVWYGVDPLAIMYPFNTGYVYCSANPVMRIDPDGRFDIETGEIEKGDNLTDITKQINQKYNTNFTVDQVAEANNIKNKDKIYAGNFIKLPGQEVKEREQTSEAISLREITVHPDRTNRQLGRYNMLISGFCAANGVKTEILDATVRYNYKSANSYFEFSRLRPSQQLWRQTNTLGNAGLKYLKFSKGLGVLGFGTQIILDVSQVAHAYNKGDGLLWRTAGKATLDIAMGYVATFCGPVGLGIGLTYMALDYLGVWDNLFGLKGDPV